MTGKIDEKVSALVDGELPRDEVYRLVDDMKRDKTGQMCWSHYHLISDALKNNLPDELPEDFVSRVSQALETEPYLASPPRHPIRTPAFHRPTIGFALAASVAAVAFVGLGWNNQTAVDQSPSLAMNAAPTPISAAPVVSYTKVHGRQWDVEQPAVISKLNSYLLSHDQFSSVAVVHNGVLPQVRIVGYERADNMQQDPVMTDNGR